MSRINYVYDTYWIERENKRLYFYELFKKNEEYYTFVDGGADGYSSLSECVEAARRHIISIEQGASDVKTD